MLTEPFSYLDWPFCLSQQGLLKLFPKSIILILSQVSFRERKVDGIPELYISRPPACLPLSCLGTSWHGRGRSVLVQCCYFYLGLVYQLFPFLVDLDLLPHCSLSFALCLCSSASNRTQAFETLVCFQPRPCPCCLAASFWQNLCSLSLLSWRKTARCLCLSRLHF